MFRSLFVIFYVYYFDQEFKQALIHKSSVNNHGAGDNFIPIPFLVFGEKIRTRAVSCKQTTMVTPLQLILFGSKKVEVCSDGMVRLDGWLPLNMAPNDAAHVVALRPALNAIFVRATENPESLGEPPSDAERLVMDCVRELCLVNAGRCNMPPVDQQRQQSGYNRCALFFPHGVYRTF